MKAMEEIHYLLGNSCDLNCDFCFWDAKLADVPLEFKKRIIDQIVKTGIKRVTLSGGEPLCASNFLETLEYTKNNGLEVILHTNGLRINESLAKQIAPLVSRVSLTFDAADEEVMAKMRGRGEMLGQNISLIRTFNELKVPVNVKTLLTRINKDQMESIGETLSGLPIQYWSILEFIPLNRGKTNKEKFFLSSEDFNDIYGKIKERFPSMDIRARRFSENNDNYCFIAANGDVYTYRNNKDTLMGSIKEEDLSAIISRI